MIRSADPVRLPARPGDPPPVGFPVIASVAPLAAAGVIWAITGSGFALVFAVLSPVIAVASMLDGRRTNRRRRRQDAAAYSGALASARTAVTERHELERRVAWQRTPSARSILEAAVDENRWQSPTGTLVALGSGPVASEVRVDGAGDALEHRELRDWAATLAGAPLTVDPRGGIGVVGPRELSRSFARGLLVQLCFAVPPGRCGLRAPPAGWAWTGALPHAAAESPAEEIVVSEGPPWAGAGSGAAPLGIALADSVEALRPGCETVVRVHGPGRAEIVRSSAHERALEFRPELVATEQAARFAAVLRGKALAAGLGADRRPLPATVALAGLGRPRARVQAGATPSLECAIGLDERGEVSLDLVGSGPHAVVGGTTGSGKSELLVTWVASMAARYSPAQVTFLLVDFKGGAAFRPLRSLVHCVGLITDLDEREAARALASLAAEMRFRERSLRDAGAREIGDAGPATPPRLVIVVDEFAAMLDSFPQLHALFVDIAARGRSLGVHLILCTQRPAGVVRESLLANCSLRLSLRVNNRADSQAVIGTDAAAGLSPDSPGRCVVRTPTGTLLCQVATTAERDIREIIDGTRPGPSPRRPWLDPLPAIVTEQHLLAVSEAGAADVPARHGGYLLGLLDEPNRQRYRVASYDPDADGHLLVVGGARSGKSSLLAALASQSRPSSGRPTLVPADVEATWDVLEGARRSFDVARDAESPGRLVLLDDFDSVCARWDPDHRAAAIDLLTGVLRDGPAARLHLVVVVQRLAGALQALPALCQSGLLLRLPNAQDHLAAGGLAAQFDDSLPPGGGTWRGSRIQLLRQEPGARATPPGSDVPILGHGPGRTLLVVSGTPARSAATMRAVLDGRDTVIDITSPADTADGRLGVVEPSAGTVFVGDADAWQAQWGLLGALRHHASIVFDGCSLADYRLIGRRRDLPPPLAPGAGHLWVLRPDGTVSRATLGAARAGSPWPGRPANGTA